MKNNRLGKGLDALLSISPEILENNKREKIAEVQLEEIKSNKYQPRKDFDEEKLAELALSIKEHGLIQPIVLRKEKEGYQLVVGERRLRASELLGLETIPAIIKDFTEEELSELALIENIQRDDLNPIEEALAYQRLMAEFKLTQEEIAKKLGKSRSFIANFVRILKLPREVLEYVEEEKLSMGHIRPLLALESPEEQKKLAEFIYKKNLNVRQSEELSKKYLKKPQVAEKERKKIKNPEKIALENHLCSLLGTKVSINNDQKIGKIEIEFYSEDDLKRIIDLFNGEDF